MGTETVRIFFASAHIICWYSDKHITLDIYYCFNERFLLSKVLTIWHEIPSSSGPYRRNLQAGGKFKLLKQNDFSDQDF